MEGFISLGKQCNPFVTIGLFYVIFIVLITLQSSELGVRTTGTIKTQLATFSRAFNLPWPKALSLVLLNLGSAASTFFFTKQSLVALCIWMKGRMNRPH